MKEDTDLLLDLKGLKCPLPVLRTRKTMRALRGPCVVRVETTDPLATIDIPHLCSEEGFGLLSQERTASGHVFRIRKPA